MGYCWDMCVLSSSNIAVSYEGGAFSFSHDGELRFTHIVPPGTYCTCGSISPCGILAYVAKNSKSNIQVVNMESSGLQVIETSYECVFDVTITPIGDQVFGSVRNSERFFYIHLWDVNSGSQLKTIISYSDTAGLHDWKWTSTVSISP